MIMIDNNNDNFFLNFKFVFRGYLNFKFFKCWLHCIAFCIFPVWVNVFYRWKLFSLANKKEKALIQFLSLFIFVNVFVCLFVKHHVWSIFGYFFFRFRFRFTPDKMICKTKRKIHYLFIMFEFFFCSFLVMFIFPEIQKSKINLFSLSLFESIQRPLNWFFFLWLNLSSSFVTD